MHHVSALNTHEHIAQQYSPSRRLFMDDAVDFCVRDIPITIAKATAIEMAIRIIPFLLATMFPQLYLSETLVNKRLRSNTRLYYSEG